MQQIAWFDNESGERGELRLEHGTGEAERFYRELKERGVRVRVGIEASGHTRWFERLLAELEMELWIGNPAKIAAQRVRKQKTDRGDAQLLLQLLREDRFPTVWGRARRTAICGNCCGTGIVWCRCGRGSRTNCTPSP
jgi:hypothetical protein